MDTFLETLKNKSHNIGGLVNFVSKRVEYLTYIEKNIPEQILDRTLTEKLYYIVNNIKDILLCDCGNHLKFQGFKNGYYKTCGDQKCVVESRKKTCMEVFGVDNPKKSQSVLEKEQKNIKEKWGGEHYMKNGMVQRKFNQSMLDKWGVEWSSQSPELKEKSLETWINNPNRQKIIDDRRNKFISKSDDEKRDIKEKKLQTILDKWGNLEKYSEHVKEMTKYTSRKNWGVDHHLSSENVIRKRVLNYIKKITSKIIDKLPSHIRYIDRNSNHNGTDSYINLECDLCRNSFSITRQLLDKRFSLNQEICLICNPIYEGTSQKELDLLEFIKSNYGGEILHRSKICNIEIDIFLPEIKIGFEFNGLYWHSEIYKEKKYHLSKTQKMNELGFKLIHIWEDDWDFKRSIVESIILNQLNRTTHKIGARKCETKFVSNEESREFQQQNHLQGFVGSKVKLGLYYNGDLVSLMTFGALRVSLGQSSKENNYELLRFCNKLNYNVVGSASKLLDFFVKNFQVEKIISYADYSRSNGSLYNKLGFKFISTSEPNYYYIVDSIRKHRFNFRKDKLIKNGQNPNLTESEIMKSIGINKIWDCGTLKYEIEF